MGHSPKITSISAQEATLPKSHFFSKLPVISGLVGIICLGALLAMALTGEGHDGHSAAHGIFASYQFAFLTFFTITVGGIFFVLIQFAAKAGWSVTVRRYAENIGAVMPLFAILFVPVIFGMHDLFHHWIEADPTDPVLAGKLAYLNPTGFMVRAVCYFFVLCFVALYYWKKSTTQDKTGDHDLSRSMQKYSYAFIAPVALALTFAGFDWLMSPDPHWYSTMFGVYLFAGGYFSIHALIIVLSYLTRGVGPLKDAITKEHYHDLGKFLFAFTIFWTYIAFSQFFIIWYANIPEDTLWYKHRLIGGWDTVTWLLAIGHFPVPFFFLLSRHIKRRPTLLFIGAIWALIIHIVDIYWIIMPNYRHHFHVELSDILAFFGVGGLFLAVLTTLMKKTPLVPVGDPKMEECLGFQNF